MEIESWLAFCSIAFIASATPGPAVLVAMTNSLQFGVAKSVFTIFGNISGLFIMSIFSVVGLSTLVLFSSTAFTIIKTVGAVYLLYMGIRLWRNGLDLSKIKSSRKENKGAFNLYIQGLLVALSNPKAIVFTTALFPQFIIISEPLLPQFSILVATFMIGSFSCLFIYSLLAQKLKQHSGQRFSGKTMGKIFGSTFIGAGAILATVQR